RNRRRLGRLCRRHAGRRRAGLSRTRRRDSGDCRSTAAGLLRSAAMDRDFSLAELLITACADAFRGKGEIRASGIGVIPRLGASLAKLPHSPELMMTDGEAFLVEDPVPLGPREAEPPLSGYMSYARVFDIVWSGRRHVIIG